MSIRQKMAARHLQRGDRVGSGEMVLSISTGARTPAGKVEVVLEKSGRRRAATWDASTIISIKREETNHDH